MDPAAARSSSVLLQRNSARGRLISEQTLSELVELHVRLQDLHQQLTAADPLVELLSTAPAAPAVSAAVTAVAALGASFGGRLLSQRLRLRTLPPDVDEGQARDALEELQGARLEVLHEAHGRELGAQQRRRRLAQRRVLKAEKEGIMNE